MNLRCAHPKPKADLGGYQCRILANSFKDKDSNKISGREAIAVFMMPLKAAFFALNEELPRGGITKRYY
ncbi:hypothetical protein ACT3CE_15115 [Marinifilum sp. RC60d5]|uniref:hypothetical protein n=1 Tax=Marinifilum sp. RC60d5 TaxID=3458414 RepID=UPI004035A330